MAEGQSFARAFEAHQFFDAFLVHLDFLLARQLRQLMQWQFWRVLHAARNVRAWERVLAERPHRQLQHTLIGDGEAQVLESTHDIRDLLLHLGRDVGAAQQLHRRELFTFGVRILWVDMQQVGTLELEVALLQYRRLQGKVVDVAMLHLGAGLDLKQVDQLLVGLLVVMHNQDVALYFDFLRDERRVEQHRRALGEQFGGLLGS